MTIEAPITYLRVFTSEASRAHPEQVIIATAEQLLFKIRRSLSTQRPHSDSQQSRKYRKIDELVKIGRISKAAWLADSLEQATDVSGWSNRLLKHLYLHADDRSQLAENYAAFFNKQLRGELSAYMQKYLAPVRLCLIPKTKNPSDFKFRPIGIGEPLFRLLGRAILSRVGKEIGNQMTPLQLAVDVSGGVEIAATMAGMLHAMNETQPPEEPEFAMMSLDVSNAFNNIRRCHILEGLRLHCPGLIPYFKLICGAEVKWI